MLMTRVAYQRMTLLILLWVILAGSKAFAADKYSIYSFSVHGATCVACIIEIDKLLRNTKGIRAVSINQAKRPLTVAVVFDQTQVQPATISKILETRKYQVADGKTMPYNKSNVSTFLPQDKVRADDNKPNLIIP